MGIKTKIKKSDIQPGMARTFLIGEQKIVLCNIDGQCFAVEDVCSHDNGELVSGEAKLIDNCQLQCPRHGARFDVKTGEAKRMPAVAPIAIFKVVEKDEELEIEIES